MVINDSWAAHGEDNMWGKKFAFDRHHLFWEITKLSET